MTRVLALDLASATGWCADNHEARRPDILFGTYQCREKGEDESLGFMGLRIWLMETIQQLKPDLVVYEAPIMFGGKDGSNIRTSAASTDWLKGLVAIVKCCCAESGISYLPAHIQGARNAFVGHTLRVKGKNKTKIVKGFVVQRCRQLGYQPEDDNAADAIAIWYWGKSQAKMEELYRGVSPEENECLTLPIS